ncbi:CRISPR-associated endonuclease Cas3'' [Candidatus Caldatribacterium saccharofermentans]|uniref:CRISPR-associated endonuclease Cas3'' n=1 Tax=Candidatus Caldatribacterium saccharofermentans TaxID=1454753 RepID=UPI003CFD3D3F
MRSDRAITPSEALGAYERAFRAGYPAEVESLLREMLNVQVAVVDDIERAKQQIAQGKRFKTVTVPYGVFLGKSKGKKIWLLGFESLKQTGADNVIQKVGSREEILPNRTYILLRSEAGYSQTEGLTFEGEGETTGFEEEPEAERREKSTEGQFQSWKEHSYGVWQRSERIANLYRPFVEAWAGSVLSEHWDGEEKKKNAFVEIVLWAIRFAALLHDVGKLNQEWQEVVWRNEKHIQNGSVNKDTWDPFIARTSSASDKVRKQLQKPPAHAPFAYPFLKTLLRNLVGDYRLWDIVALAAARHHSLEVTGAFSSDQFQWDNGAETFLRKLIEEVLGELLEEDKKRLEGALAEASKAICSASKADEPPGPTDDLYFLYCLANRLVKVCDWEDAGNQEIELKG